MKAANCDLVVLGTIIRETIGTVGEARKTGFNPTFLGSSAAYTDLIHKLGGKPMDGIYATMTVQNPYTGRAVAAAALLGQQVQDQVQRRPDGVLGLRLHDHRRLHPGGAEGRPEPDHRQLHQGDGQHDLRARHVRRAEDDLHARPSAWATTSRACRRSSTASGRWCRTTWRLELFPAPNKKPPEGGFFFPGSLQGYRGTGFAGPQVAPRG